MSTKQIVVVGDDDDQMRDLIQRVLNEEGIATVFTARDEMDVREAMRHESADTVMVFVLDNLGWETGRRGYELAQRLHTSHRRVIWTSMLDGPPGVRRVRKGEPDFLNSLVSAVKTLLTD